jgi:hypothetical protein
VIITTSDKVEVWMRVAPDKALKLQRPAAGLRIVARGVKKKQPGRPDDRRIQ